MIVTFMSGCLRHEPIQEVFDPPAEGHEATHGVSTCGMALYHEYPGDVKETGCKYYKCNFASAITYLFCNTKSL